jgi:hypothetical protein
MDKALVGVFRRVVADPYPAAVGLNTAHTGNLGKILNSHLGIASDLSGKYMDPV